MYYRDADAAIIVYDISSNNSFVKAKKWAKDVDEETDGAMKFVVGNKCDKVD